MNDNIQNVTVVEQLLQWIYRKMVCEMNMKLNLNMVKLILDNHLIFLLK